MAQEMTRTENNMTAGAAALPAGSRLEESTRVLRQEAGNRMLRALRLLLFPAVFLYLELVLHLYMEMSLEYAPVYLIFGLSAGCFFSALSLLFSPKTGRILTRAAVILICLVYSAELAAKSILQTYYPLSILETASENRLTDFTDVILEHVPLLLPALFLTALPCVLVFLRDRRTADMERTGFRVSGLLFAAAVFFHVLGLLTLRLPWKGDLTPGMLYRSDSGMEDQVEQLGLWTMLRLDVKHMLFPPEAALSEDFGALKVLGASTAPSSDVPAPAALDASAPGAQASGISEAGSGISEAGSGISEAGSGISEAGSGTPAAPPGGEEGLAAAPGTGEEEEKEPVMQADTSPNIMDVDLAALAQETDNSGIAWLASYFNGITPTNKNRYTGMFRGYNVIQLVLEGFSGYAIDPELTPTLYRLAHEGFVFHNYYTALHFTSTSNGECQTLLGLYPKNGSPVTMKRTGVLGTNCYFALARQLGRAGYLVKGYHNNQDMYGRNRSHTNLGYDWKYYTNGLACEENASGTDRLWPQRDKYMIEASIDEYINSDVPFHVYYLTVSGHTSYGWNRVASQYRELVSGLPYSEKTRSYVAAAAVEVDRALEYLLQRLEEAGKLDKTLIVATGDHIPYADVDVLEELAGRRFGTSAALTAINESSIDFDVYRNTLILWSASMEEPVEVDKVCCQVDILPTVSNLLGLEYDSRMLSGGDILSDREGLVVFSSRSWKTDRGFYNRFTQTFTPAEGVSMTAEEQQAYVEAMKQLVNWKLESTARIVENDFYQVVFGDDTRLVGV